MDRRAFLAGTGALVTGATAGCLGVVPGLGGDDGIDTSSPEAVVDSYLTVVSNPGDVSEEDLRGLFHSEIVDQVEDSLGSFGGGQTDTEFDVSITDIEGPNLVAEDVSAAQIREELDNRQTAGPSQGGRGGVFDDEFIDRLGAGETAFVDVRYTLETEFENPQTDETQSTEVTTAERVIVAREDGEWQVVTAITRSIEAAGE